SRSFRRDRATLYIETDQDAKETLRQFDTLVAKKLEVLCQQVETPEWLKVRLTKLVTLRRQQFYYQKAHASYLAGRTRLSQREHRPDISGTKPALHTVRISGSNPQTFPARKPTIEP